MKKIIKKLAVAVALMPALALASEVTGTLNVGIQTGISGTVLEAPSASPAPGTYTNSVSITLTKGTGATEARYTTDGSTPDCTSSSVYSSPITLSSTATIKAVSCYPGPVASAVASFAYTINQSSGSGSSGSSGGNGNSGGTGGSTGGGGGTPSTGACGTADFNGDGKVDLVDMNILVNHFGLTPVTHADGDADCDGDVDIVDMNILVNGWTG